MADQVFAGLCGILFFIGIGYGVIRPAMSPLAEDENLPTLRLVQPGIPLIRSWTRDDARKYYFETLELSEQKKDEKPDIVIWPESPLPIPLAEEVAAQQHIAKILKKDGYFIGGTLQQSFTKEGKVKIWNSLIVLNQEGKITHIYDKHLLVPFGEFVPFRSILPSGIVKITSGDTDFSRGKGPETVTIPPYPPFSPLICFEAIFSGKVIAKGSPRPRWLLNITNDAWFGQTSGPYQHLQLARMRSIEEGLPLIRAANTGISIVFDSFGVEIKRLGLDKRGVLDVKLPPALKEPTIFAKYGSLIYIGLMVFVLFMSLIIRSPLKK